MRKLTTEEFIKRAKNRHGDRYDYSKSKIVPGDKYVTIGCAEHGDFRQIYSNHIKGANCPKCGYKKEGKIKLPDSDEMKKKIVEVHGDHYSFEHSEFKFWKTKTTITCKYHGDFQVAPTKLLSTGKTYRGCPRCGIEKRTALGTSNTETFVSRAKAVHGSKYDYSSVEYVKALQKVQIICPIHGEFSQTPAKHLAGQGCSKCGDHKVSQRMRQQSNGWSYTEWEKAGAASDNFDGYKLYVIKCADGDGTTFYKIGKTFNTLQERFRTAVMPYAFTEVKVVTHNAYAISTLEKRLHKKYADCKYTPTKDFAGMHECFTLSDEQVKEIIEELAAKYDKKENLEVINDQEICTEESGQVRSDEGDGGDRGAASASDRTAAGEMGVHDAGVDEYAAGETEVKKTFSRS